MVRYKKYVAASQHFGASNAIAPVIAELLNLNKEVIILAHNQAEIKFKEPRWNFDFKTTNQYDVSNELSAFNSQSMKKILDKAKPDFVLTGSSTERTFNGLEKSLILSTNEMNIPNAMVVDGWPDSEYRFNDYTNEGNLIIPGKVFVVDKQHKDLIIEQGIPSNIIKITGNPSFDEDRRQYEFLTENQLTNIKKQVGVEQNQKLIFYSGNAFKSHSEQETRGYWDYDNIIAINRTLKQNLDLDLKVIIRLHNRMIDDEPETVKEIEQYLSDEGDSHLTINYEKAPSNKELAFACDIFVTPFSTDGVTAAICNKLVLSLQGRDKNRLVTNDVGITYRVEGRIDSDKGVSYPSLSGIVNKLVKETSYVKELCPNLQDFIPDGKSVERILAEI